jgi:hypothetical protein
LILAGLIPVDLIPVDLGGCAAARHRDHCERGQQAKVP